MQRVVEAEKVFAPKILFLCDMDLRGSGYMRIMTQLGKQLVEKHGRRILALGLHYDARAHDWPFSIIPVARPSDLIGMLASMAASNYPIDAVVLGFDIPLQIEILKAIKQDTMHPVSQLSTIGIFPLEAEPLSMSWASGLHSLDHRIIMTQFGKTELEKYGMQVDFIPVAIDDGTQLWQRRTKDDYKKARKGLGIPDDTMMVLTVADNQERKHLSGGMEIISKFAVDILDRNDVGFATKTAIKRKVEWHLLTRVKSPIGYDLLDLAMRHGVQDQLKLYDRGLPPKQLRSLFLAADAFMLTSKAEGLAVPMLEAMKIGVPVLATDCTAMQEHGVDDRAFLIDAIYAITDPFGNGLRRFVNADVGAMYLEYIADAKTDDDKRLVVDGVVNKAYEYVIQRSWDAASIILNNAIDTVHKRKQAEILISQGGEERTLEGKGVLRVNQDDVKVSKKDG